MEEFSRQVMAVLRRIPEGRVSTYGAVAAMAGNPRGARQVVRILHSSSTKEHLPWHRVINASGRISLPRGGGYELQRALLIDEGIVFSIGDRIDLKRYGWNGS